MSAHAQKIDASTVLSSTPETAEIAAGHALRRPLAVGSAASVALLAFYFGTVTLLQGQQHAAELLLGDWYLVGPIALGFGAQAGLFFYLRHGLKLRKGTGQATAAAGASTGTSSIAMLACCAHHLTDVLPFLSLAGPALFLSEYRQPLMILGIASNGVGIALMVRMIRRHVHR